MRNDLTIRSVRQFAGVFALLSMMPLALIVYGIVIFNS